MKIFKITHRMAAYEIEFAKIENEIRVVALEEWLDYLRKIREAVFVEVAGECHESIRFSVCDFYFVIDLSLHGEFEE